MSDTNLSVIPQPENPGQLMRQATDVAGVCREIVLKTACNIQGRKYVKAEGWMAIATAHGCVAGSRDVQRVEGGWVAIGEIRRISDGVLISQAEGYVGKDEKRWGNADEYACRAMAQTRAISRACRAAFAHVVVLIDGGLSTTPAEEVPDGGFDNAKPVRQPSLPHIQRTSTATTPLAPAPVSPFAFKSDKERTAWVNAHLLKCKLKLVSDLEKGDPQAAVEFMQKSGHLLPNETAISEANEITLFPSVPHSPGESEGDGHGIMQHTETDGDWRARVNEAVAKDALAIKRAFEAFQNGDQIPDAEVGHQEAEPEQDHDPVPDGAMHLKIDVVAVSKKEGQSARGKWVRYGVKDENDNWYGTFSHRVGTAAEALKGGKATIFYTETEKGYDLHKIIKA